MALQLLLGWINSVKIGLTSLPLTVLDIKIALANPAGLWDALALPHWTRHAATFAIAVAVLSWCVAGLIAAARFVASCRTRISTHDPLLRLAAVCIVAILGLSRLEALYADAALDNSTWQLDGVAALADKMGALPFLGYSYNLESQSTGDIYRDESGVVPPSTAEVRSAVLQYMDFTAGTTGSRVQPNIMVVLAESTFDPGAMFRLQGKWNDALFRAGERHGGQRPAARECDGRRHLDHRVRNDRRPGLAGSSVIPGCIPMHPSRRSWIKASPSTCASTAIARRRFFRMEAISITPAMRTRTTGSKPFSTATTWVVEPGWRPIAKWQRAFARPWAQRRMRLSSVMCSSSRTIHRTTACTGDARASQSDSPTRRNSPPTARCTSTCVGSTRRRLPCSRCRSYLADIEARTGRPFVLLVFGDHQPHTFSSTGGFQYDYSGFRQIADTRMTFFHVISSVPGKKLRCCSVIPPPRCCRRCLSGYVANSPDDVYLGINLWLHARCGTDAVRRDFGNFMSKLSHRGTLRNARTPALPRTNGH